MITESEYIEALRIVQQYHNQIGLISAEPKPLESVESTEGPSDGLTDLQRAALNLFVPELPVSGRLKSCLYQFANDHLDDVSPNQLIIGDYRLKQLFDKGLNVMTFIRTYRVGRKMLEEFEDMLAYYTLRNLLRELN